MLARQPAGMESKQRRTDKWKLRLTMLARMCFLFLFCAKGYVVVFLYQVLKRGLWPFSHLILVTHRDGNKTRLDSGGTTMLY